VGLVYVWVNGDLNWFKKVVIPPDKRRPIPEEATAI
jgi:hypothetical protein